MGNTHNTIGKVSRTSPPSDKKGSLKPPSWKNKNKMSTIDPQFKLEMVELCWTLRDAEKKERKGKEMKGMEGKRREGKEEKIKKERKT